MPRHHRGPNGFYMANKKVKVTECCVITNDDKGQRSLVGSAREALTTLSKSNIDVTIFLESTDKDAAEKFLKENNVPYKDLLTREDYKDGKPPRFDACIVGDDNVVMMRGDWKWTLNELADKLYDGREKQPHKSEQQKMDDKWKEYRHWAEEANRSRQKRLADVPVG